MLKNKDKLKINTLENEIDTLKNIIKDNLYKEFMAKLSEPMEIQRLKRENKRLRKQNKTLKELLKKN